MFLQRFFSSQDPVVTILFIRDALRLLVLRLLNINNGNLHVPVMARNNALQNMVLVIN